MDWIAVPDAVAVSVVRCRRLTDVTVGDMA